MIAVVSAGDVENGREDVVNHPDVLGVDDAGRNGALFLKRVLRIRLGPRGDERHSHTAFVMSAFLGAERRGTRNIVSSTCRCIATVVAEEHNEGVLSHAEFFEVIKHVVE